MACDMVLAWRLFLLTFATVLAFALSARNFVRYRLKISSRLVRPNVNNLLCSCRRTWDIARSASRDDTDDNSMMRHSSC